MAAASAATSAAADEGGSGDDDEDGGGGALQGAPWPLPTANAWSWPSWSMHSDRT